MQNFTQAAVVTLVGAFAIGAFTSLGSGFEINLSGSAIANTTQPALTSTGTAAVASTFGKVRRAVEVTRSIVAAPTSGPRPSAGSRIVPAAAATGDMGLVREFRRMIASGEITPGELRIRLLANNSVHPAYFTNHEALSALNCTECTIAMDERLAGNYRAIAAKASLDRFAAENGIELGTGAMDEALNDPKIVKALTTADDEVSELAALYRGEVTFDELQAQGRPTIEKAVAVLRAHDFAKHDDVWRGMKPDYSGLDAAQKRDVRNAYRRSKYAVDKVRDAVREVEELPHVQLMNRFTAQDYSLYEVAVRRQLDPNDILEFATPEAQQWVQLPVWELDEDFGPTFMGMAERSGQAIEDFQRHLDKLNDQVQADAGWDGAAGPDNLGRRGALSIVFVDPASGGISSHVLNVIIPRRDTSNMIDASRIGPYMEDGQIKQVYRGNDFTEYTYPHILHAQFIETGDFVEPLPNPGTVSGFSGKPRPLSAQRSHGTNLANAVWRTQEGLAEMIPILQKVFAD